MGRPATTVDEALKAGWYLPNEMDGLCHCGCGERAPLATKSNPRDGYVRGQPKRYVHGHRIRLGDHMTPETREKIGAAQREKLSWRWKGSDVGYSAIHYWLRTNFEKTGICEHCGADVGTQKGGTEWANAHPDRIYRRCRDDYVELCRACHVRFDRS